ncbi:hypothetical protein GCM10009663_16160 [Kitasatospora arboriphila]|uniref:Uncharacterized protein n=1 Tax=Kitasatospora arboriphila TaxID=258052 RepID=A0ABP4DZR2_9ACTN
MDNAFDGVVAAVGPAGRDGEAGRAGEAEGARVTGRARAAGGAGGGPFCRLRPADGPRNVTGRPPA